MPLHRYFAQVWAVDQEPEMAGAVAEKADAAGAAGIWVLACGAEDLDAPDGARRWPGGGTQVTGLVLTYLIRAL